MADEPNLYELLQVDRRASQEVIEAAYHRLVRKYHPDLNKSADASVIMQRLNNAYAILKDPIKRGEYDRRVFGTQEQSKAEERTEPSRDAGVPKPIACQNCGRIDATLRATVFQYVFSLIIMSFKRGGGAGILCSRCRNGRAIGYSLLSLVLGPWGIPWGILWTVEALWVNLTGGRQPPEVNGPLLRAHGAYFLSRGQLSPAVEALEGSLNFEENAQVREILRTLRLHKENDVREKKKTSDRQPQSGDAVRVIGILAILALFIGGLVFLPAFGIQSNPAPTNPAPTLESRAVSTDTPRPFVSPTPAISRITTEGPSKYGLRIGDVEWNVRGYTLADYARMLEVQMLFRNVSFYRSEQLQMDFRLRSDGQEAGTNSIQIASIDFVNNYYYDARPISIGTWYTLEPSKYILGIVVFNTPPSCATAGDQIDACMRQKETKIRWPQYNILDTLFQFR